MLLDERHDDLRHVRRIPSDVTRSDLANSPNRIRTYNNLINSPLLHEKVISRFAKYMTLYLSKRESHYS